MTANVPGGPIGRDVGGRTPRARPDLVPEARDRGPHGIGRAELRQRGKRVRERALRDDRGDARVGRGERDHVPAGERRAEQRDAVTVEARQRPGVGDGGTVVGMLAADVEQLTRLAPARAEMAIVEQQDPEAGGGEALRVGVEALVAGRREAVGHDDDRACGPSPGGRYSQAAQSTPSEAKVTSVRSTKRGA